MKIIQRMIALILIVALLPVSDSIQTETINRYDGYTNDAEISQSKYNKNKNKYHYIFQMGLAGPGKTAWDYATGKGVNVAVFDSGANVSHKDLAANVKGCYNAVTDTEGIDAVVDEAGHGTATSGIISAVGNNNFLSAGIAYDANLYVVKVDTEGTNQSYWDSLIRGFEYAKKKKCRVISISLSDEYYNEQVQEAITALYNQKENSILVFASCGNKGIEQYRYPASYENVMSVTALSYSSGNYTIRTASNFNDAVDIAAPGQGIYTLTNQNNTGSKTSAATSAATPYAAGVAALVFQADPSLTAAQCENIIKTTAMDAGAKGYDKVCGYGIIQPLAAVKKAKGITDTTSGNTISKKTTLKKPVITLKRKSKSKIRVSWKKDVNCTGYMIYVSANSKFKKQKKIKISKRSITKKVVSKLKKGKKYYVRMRSYKIKNGKKTYSSYSKVKKIKL